VKAADEPDLAILLAGAYRALIDRLDEAMEARRIEGMRPSFGFVIRAVDAEQPTITRLAEMLDVTKQSASALADEAERAGFVERVAAPEDRRSRHLRLTAKGRKVRATALAASEKLEHELGETLGLGGLAAMRAGLLEIVARSGGLEDVLARRSRLVW
jgi:DNA-binding MarR family transcriptional regulator